MPPSDAETETYVKYVPAGSEEGSSAVFQNSIQLPFTAFDTGARHSRNAVSVHAFWNTKQLFQHQIVKYIQTVLTVNDYYTTE